MAYVVDDEDRRKQLESGMVGGGASFQPQQSVQAQPTSSGFVDFDRYFNANQAQSEAYANKLAGDLEQQGSKTKSDIESAKGSAMGDVSKGTLSGPVYGTRIVRTESYPQQTIAGGKGPLLGRAAAVPALQKRAGVTAGPVLTLGQAQQKAAAGYSGPTGLTDEKYGYTDLSSRAQDVAGRARALQTAGGIQAVGGGGALGGALVGRAGAKQFSDLQSKYGDLDKFLSGAATEVRNAAKGATDTSVKAQVAYGKLAQAEQEKRAQDEATAQGQANKKEDDANFVSSFGNAVEEKARSMPGQAGMQLSATYKTIMTPEIMQQMTPEERNELAWLLGKAKSGIAGIGTDDRVTKKMIEMRQKYGGRR